MSDTMLIGVLRMSLDTTDDITMEQFIDRARQAADRIESDADEITRLQAENEALRSQVEQLQGRCVELESVMASIRDIARFPPADKQILKYAESALSGGNAKARDLRLQAEAVEKLAEDFDKEIHHPDFIPSQVNFCGPRDYCRRCAQRLRDQAGEIERGGGDGCSV